MKKKEKEKIADCLKEARAIRDTLTGNAREFADAVVGVLETLEADDEEHSVEEVFAEVDRLKEQVNRTEEETRENVANRIQKLENKIAGMQSGGQDKKNVLTKKVANEVAKAILNANGKDGIADSVAKVLKRNGIEGITAAEIVDWSIELKLEDLNPLWRQFHKTMRNTWYYNADDFLAAFETVAHQQTKHGSTKDIQSFVVSKKQISTDYIYKLQSVAFKDLDDIEEAGGLQDFLQMISNELYQIIVDTIVQYIITGSTANADSQSGELATFESVQSAGPEFVTQALNLNLTAFLTALGYDTSDIPTLLNKNTNARLAAIRYTSDQVWNPRSKHKVALMSGAMLTKISAYRYSENGDLLFRSKEDVAAQIGVDEIITSDLMGGNVTIMLPDGYWVKEVKSIEVAYPIYEKNVRNFQKEINAGGAFHDILCCATINLQA